MDNLAIIGYGGFGKEIEFLIKCKFPKIKLVIYDDTNTSENILSIDKILNIDYNLNCVIAIGDPNSRLNIYNKLKLNTYLIFPNIIFSTFKSYPFSKDILMGVGNIIMPNVTVGINSVIGSHNVIGMNVGLGHDVEIGNYNFIGPNSFLAGSVKIGDNCKLSFGTSFMQKSSIVSETNTMPYTVIYRKIKKSGTYIGNPAKLM
jgi:carbonic anhydrase/acetyltransferase-like protein (isoleucine patch superfamily)